jgi:hypothetical protein
MGPQTKPGRSKGLLVVRGTLLLLLLLLLLREGWGTTKHFTVPRQYPLVPPVNVGWKQGRGWEVKNVGGMLEVCSRGQKVSIWAGFCVWVAAL